MTPDDTRYRPVNVASGRVAVAADTPLCPPRAPFQMSPSPAVSNGSGVPAARGEWQARAEAETRSQGQVDRSHAAGQARGMPPLLSVAGIVPAVSRFLLSIAALLVAAPIRRASESVYGGFENQICNRRSSRLWHCWTGWVYVDVLPHCIHFSPFLNVLNKIS